jgi:AcrR family transcriptional regulator
LDSPNKTARELLQAIIVRLPDPTKIDDGGHLRSAVTRRKIMLAAADCLDRFGYVGTNLAVVAKQSKLTRAAVIYHFPSRMSLIEAVIYFVLRERIRQVTAMLDLDQNSVPMRVDFIWSTLQTNIFRAFAELLIAAKTDKALAAVFDPALEEYERCRKAVSFAVMPERDVRVPWFALRLDLGRFLLEGLTIQGIRSPDAEERMYNIRSFVKVLLSRPAGAALMREAVTYASTEKLTKFSAQPRNRKYASPKRAKR